MKTEEGFIRDNVLEMNKKLARIHGYQPAKIMLGFKPHLFEPKLLHQRYTYPLDLPKNNTHRHNHNQFLDRKSSLFQILTDIMQNIPQCRIFLLSQDKDEIF